MREHSLIWRDPEEFPRLRDGKLIGGRVERAMMERGAKSQNTQIFKSFPLLSLSLSLSPLSLFLPRSALAPQICVTKWTYNWKSGGPEILLTFPLSRLHISSGELRGWCEHMGRRWGEEKVIRRSLLLLFVGDFLILYTFFFLFLPCFFFSDLYFLPNTSIFSSPATMFLIIVCLFTFVILCGHPWWYHRVPGHCVHACVCACVCVCVCVCVWIQNTPVRLLTHTLTESQKVRFASESLFPPGGCWESPIVWAE